MYIMWKDEPVWHDGEILDRNMMPWGYVDTGVPEADFTAWCAGRMFRMSKSNAKWICNATAREQDDSNDTRVDFALRYNSLSLNDCYWTRGDESSLTWADVNLHNIIAENELTPVTLRGKAAFKIDARPNPTDLTDDGTCLKSWIHGQLYKGGPDVQQEVAASAVLRAMGFDAVEYALEDYFGQACSVSRCFTSDEVEFIPYADVRLHYGLDAIRRIKEIDSRHYYEMGIATYLIGNHDLHGHNWGLLRIRGGDDWRLAPLFDFNMAFYDTYTQPDDVNDDFRPEYHMIDIKTGREILKRDFQREYKLQYDYTLEEFAVKAAREIAFVPDITDLAREMFINEAHRAEFIRRCETLTNDC